MAEAYYEPTPATDGATMNPVPGAVFQVFEIADTAFATPLSLRVGSGNPTTTVTASETLATLPGVYVTSPNYEHIWKSGTFEWRRDSIDGAKKAIEDAKIAASNSASASDASAVSAANSAQAAQDAAALVDAPADTTIQGLINTEGSATRAALSATFARKVDAQPVTARGAVTISYDDGWLEWYTVLLPILRDEFPHQCHTLAPTPGLLGSSALYMTNAQCADLAAALPHCEFASHSQTHANMKNSTITARVTEYEDSKTNLENIIGRPGEVTSFVYPYGGVGQDANTDRELFGRYDRVVSAGNSSATTPLDDRMGMFIVPRLDEWNSSTHQKMLAMVRLAAAQPVIVNLYTHRTGTTTTVAELRELFTLCDTLGVPVINIRDAYPAGGLLQNASAEESPTGVLFTGSAPAAGWPTLGISGDGKTLDVTTTTPDAGISGTKSFHLASTNTTGFIYTGQTIPAVEGRHYTFSGRAKWATTALGAGAYARIRIQPQTLDGANIGGTIASSDAGTAWTRLTAGGVMPAGTKQLRCDIILLNTQGEAWFDHMHAGPTSNGSVG